MTNPLMLLENTTRSYGLLLEHSRALFWPPLMSFHLSSTWLLLHQHPYRRQHCSRKHTADPIPCVHIPFAVRPKMRRVHTTFDAQRPARSNQRSASSPAIPLRIVSKRARKRAALSPTSCAECRICRWPAVPPTVVRHYRRLGECSRARNATPAAASPYAADDDYRTSPSVCQHFDALSYTTVGDRSDCTM